MSHELDEALAAQRSITLTLVDGTGVYRTLAVTSREEHELWYHLWGLPRTVRRYDSRRNGPNGFSYPGRPSQYERAVAHVRHD